MEVVDDDDGDFIDFVKEEKNFAKEFEDMIKNGVQTHLEHVAIPQNIIEEQLSKMQDNPDILSDFQDIPTYVGLGHGIVLSIDHNVNLMDDQFIYKKKCGKLSSIFAAMDIIGGCRRIRHMQITTNAAKIVDIVNIDRSEDDMFVSNNIVKETSCSMVNNFLGNDYEGFKYDYLVLSGLQKIDDDIYDRVLNSICVLPKNKDGHSVISHINIRAIFDGSIYPTSSKVIEGFRRRNQDFDKTGHALLSDFLKLPLSLTLTKSLENIHKFHQSPVNVIFPNCRAILRSDKTIVADRDYPHYKIMQDLETVAQAQKNSDEFAALYKTNGRGIKKKYKKRSTKKHNRKKRSNKRFSNKIKQ